GYVITYNNSGTLTSGGDTIPDAPGDTTITNSAAGSQGTEQFALSFETDGDATVTSGYGYDTGTPANSDWAYDASPTSPVTIVSETGPTATETVSSYYLANIAANTEAGIYSASITYIATGTF
ncbi:MAG: hypothetical protein Q8Q20_03710, partial [bacterium]|nr:hypothetical protein [bacterium]